MDDFLDEFNTSESTSSSNENNSYGGNSSKSYGGNNNGGNSKADQFAKWREAQKVVQPLYLPVVVHWEYNTPQEVKDKLFEFATMLMSRGFTVRFPVEDFETLDKLDKIGGKRSEGHLVYSTFKDKDTGEERKKGYSNNNATTDAIAKEAVGFGWDKMKPFFQAKQSRNARMLVSSTLKSNAKCLIVWTPDGAAHATEVSDDTGYTGTIIKMASSVGVPVFNLNNEESRNYLNRYILKGVKHE